MCESDNDALICELEDAMAEMIKLKEEIAYLHGALDEGRSDYLPSTGVLRNKGFSIACDGAMRVTDVDKMAKACQDQIDWCEENDVSISTGGNADKN